MKMRLLVIGLTCLAAPALAADMKAGLWELKVIKGSYDGQDTAAQAQAMQQQVRQAMAKMTPEQRKQMEAMMNGQAGFLGGKDSATKMCITEEQARRKELKLDPEGRCQPSQTKSLLGDTIHYEFDCTSAQGVRTKGKADMKFSGGSIHGTTDMTTTDAQGVTHTIHQESQMTWLGADCKGIAPAASPKKK